MLLLSKDVGGFISYMAYSGHFLKVLCELDAEIFYLVTTMSFVPENCCFMLAFDFLVVAQAV